MVIHCRRCVSENVNGNKVLISLCDNTNRAIIRIETSKNEVIPNECGRDYAMFATLWNMEQNKA